MPVLGAPRDRRQPHDLRIGELERSGLTEEDLGCRRSKRHSLHAARTESWSLGLLRRETHGSGSRGDE